MRWMLCSSSPPPRSLQLSQQKMWFLLKPSHVCVAFCTVLNSLHCAANWEDVTNSTLKWCALSSCLLHESSGSDFYCASCVQEWVHKCVPVMCRDLPDGTVVAQGSAITGLIGGFRVVCLKSMKSRYGAILQAELLSAQTGCVTRGWDGDSSA